MSSRALTRFWRSNCIVFATICLVACMPNVFKVTSRLALSAPLLILLV